MEMSDSSRQDADTPAGALGAGLKLIPFIERYMRVAIAFGITVYQWITWNERNLAHQPSWLLPLLGSYWGYVIFTHIWRRTSLKYDLRKRQVIRFVLDCVFALLWVLIGRGSESNAFALLILPVFVASYRFPIRYSYRAVAALIGSYIGVCVFRGLWPGGEMNWSSLVVHSLAIGFVFYSNISSRYFLLHRLTTISQSVPGQEAGGTDHLEIAEVAKAIAKGFSAQTCLILASRREDTEVALVASSMDKNVSEQDDAFSFPIEVVGGAETIQVRRLGRMDLWRHHEKPLRQLLEARFLPPGQEFRSALMCRAEAPNDMQVVILLLNRTAQNDQNVSQAGPIGDFREEDEYLLRLCAGEIVIRAWWQAEARALQTVLDVVADEVSICDEHGTLALVNRARREAYGIEDEKDAIGKKCCKVLQRYESPSDGPPCNECLSLEAARTGEPADWTADYVHPVSKRDSIAEIRAVPVTDSLGRRQVVETVTDVTRQKKQETLRLFLGDLQTRPVQEDLLDEVRDVSKRMLKLFADLGWNRARLYEWDEPRQVLLCLGSTGHSKDIGFHDLELPVHKPPAGGKWDWISSRWVGRAAQELKPMLVFLEDHKDDEAVKAQIAEIGDQAEIMYVSSFPYSERLDKSKVTQTLDIPLVVGNELVGMVSLDSFDEKLGREAYRFSKEDVFLAVECAAVLGYVMRSSQYEHNLAALSGYVNAINHEMSIPLQVIGEHAEFLVKYFSAELVSNGRKLVKLEDILHETELLQMIVKQPEIENARSEDYQWSDTDVFRQVVLPAVNQIRDYYAPHKNDVKVSHETLCSLPKMDADRRKLKQVFMNLLVNAVKYADPKTEVVLRIDRGEDENGREVFTFDFTNRGLAIRSDELEKIFAKLFRGTGAKTYDPVGSGLGLHICRMVVENHGGRLYVLKPSDPTTFRLELPATRAIQGS